MIGSGGGFITVEPGRRVVKSSVEQPVLFDYKPVVIQRERIKINKFDSSEDQSLTLNSSNKASSEGSKTKKLEQPSEGKKTTQLEQPSKPFEGAETKQSTDSGTRQTNANSAPHEKPASKEVFDELPDNRVPDQAKDTSSDIKGELDKKNTQDKAPIVENTSTTFENDREHSKQEPPWGYQFFKGPPADVYSDPPDNVRNQSDFDGANGDSGEDKLNSSS